MSAAVMPAFSAIRVVRRTGETIFAVQLAPRGDRQATLPLPNKLLSHFLDHFAKSARLRIKLLGAEWPGSWQLDHVLCEDMGLLIGHGIAAIHQERSARDGVIGRGHSSVCMDDACAEVTFSLESRPRAQWVVAPCVPVDIDGFVDSWYGEGGAVEGWCMGTNLRQFIDGFALGSGGTLLITVQHAGNLHHLYETVFRGLGEVVGASLGLSASIPCLPGDASGLAGIPQYSIETVEEA